MTALSIGFVASGDAMRQKQTELEGASGAVPGPESAAD